MRAYRKKWAEANPENVVYHRRKNMAKWRTENPAEHSVKQKRWRDTCRDTLFAFFGNKCARCGFSDWRALQLDHVNGGGRQDPAYKHGRVRANALQLLKRSPDEARQKFQLLCANCNWIKRYENSEHGYPVV
jgi:hypothetical protein